MKIRNIAIFAAAVFAGAIAGSLVGPRPAEAVAREIIDLQRDVTSLRQGQKDMTTQITQGHTVLKTLVEQASDNVGKLNATMGSVQKSVQDVQANSGARLDTMSTQVQGLSDNLEEIKSRLGKLNQQLVDLQSVVQGIDAKVSGSAPASTTPGASPRPPMTVLPLLRQRVTPFLPRPPPPPLPPPTCFIPTACATSPAANTIWLARNFWTT
jgi:hypothetical protein